MNEPKKLNACVAALIKALAVEEIRLFDGFCEGRANTLFVVLADGAGPQAAAEAGRIAGRAGFRGMVRERSKWAEAKAEPIGVYRSLLAEGRTLYERRPALLPGMVVLSRDYFGEMARTKGRRIR